MRKWRMGWIMPSLLAALLPTAQAGELDSAERVVMTRENQSGMTRADQAQNRYWADGDFEGVIAESGGQTLAVLNSDKKAKWIVLFERAAISKSLLKQATSLQSAQATVVAGTLRQEIAQEHKQAIDNWKAKNLITKVNARFDMLVNGLAVEATGEQIKEIAKQPGVAKVYPDYVMKANLADSVPLIGAPNVWAMNDASGNPVKGSGIRVAVIDTGIDYTHSAFGSCSALNTGAGCRVIGGYDFVNKDADPKDDHNHGTHVAGIIAGSDATITGVAPEASLYAYKVLSADGWGYESDIISALQRAADPNNDGNPSDHVDAANLSLGGSGGPDDPLSKAVDQAVTAGVSVVVAAGNEGYYDYYYNTIGSPGAAAKAITVGATDKTDKLAYFSSRGPVAGSIIKPDLVAPGVSITSSVRNGGYASYNGTSMATPHVAGAVVLLKQLHPDWTPALLKAAVTNSARDIGQNPYSQGSPYAQGSGRLQLAEAASSNYLAMPSSLSMGLVDNTVPVWSKTQTLKVYNDADTAQTISLSVSSGLPNGLTASLSQSSVTLAAGESQDVSFTVTVDNNVLPYPSAEPYSYSGKVVMDNGTQVRQVPFAVIKAAQLVLNWDVKPTFVLIHNRKSGGKDLTIMEPSSPYLVILPPDTYDIISWWWDGNYTVVNEGIVLSSSTTKNISRSEASHAANFQLKDHTGAVQPATGWSHNLAVWQPSSDNGLIVISLSSGQMPFGGFVSDMSSAYRYDVTGQRRHETSNTYYAPVFSAQGISADLNMTNDYADAKRVDFTYNVSGSTLRPIFFIWARWFAANFVPSPVPNLSTDVWYLFPFPSGFYFDRNTIDLVHGEDYGDYAFSSDFIPTSKTSYTMLVRNYNPASNSYADEQNIYSDSAWQVNGSPHYWAGNTQNTVSAVVISSNANRGWGPLFVRSQWQDQPILAASDVTYELLDNSGSPVQSGNLGSSYSQTITVPQQGAYTLNTSYLGLLRGNPTAGTMIATFDTSGSDKNPPVIQELQIRENGERTDTVTDGAGQIAVRAADASAFTAEVAVDWGNGWQNLSVSASDAFQVANIPAFSPAEDKEVSLRITLTDASGNKMVNTISPAFIVRKAEGWTLSVNSSGASGVAVSSSPADYSGTTDYSKPGVLNGTSITLTAPAASGDKNFSGWSGCDSTDPAARTCTLSITSDKAVTVNYVEPPAPRTLTVKSSGSRWVPILGSPSSYSGRTDYSRKNIPDGSSITLTAPARGSGKYFSGWSGCDESDTAARTCTVIMSADKTVTANYLSPKVLIVKSAGAVLVPVGAAPSQYRGRTAYGKLAPAGASITLTAPPQAKRWGWTGAWRTFSHWNGCDATDPAARTCKIVMSSRKSVIAVYQ